MSHFSTKVKRTPFILFTLALETPGRQYLFFEIAQIKKSLIYPLLRIVVFLGAFTTFTFAQQPTNKYLQNKTDTIKIKAKNYKRIKEDDGGRNLYKTKRLNQTQWFKN